MERDCRGQKRDANLTPAGATGNQSKQKPDNRGHAAVTFPSGGFSIIRLAAEA